MVNVRLERTACSLERTACRARERRETSALSLLQQAQRRYPTSLGFSVLVLVLRVVHTYCCSLAAATAVLALVRRVK